MNPRQELETQREFLRTDANLASRRKRDAIKALERRRDWLAKRIATNPNDTAMDFLRAEKNALDWALEQLS